MKKKFIVFILFLIVLTPAKAQTTDHQVYLDIWKLLSSKIDYEKYRNFKNTGKTDSALIAYKKQTNKIKGAANVYLNYINKQIKNNKTQLKIEFLPYKYGHNVHFTHDTGGYYIKKIDLFRVIEYALRKNNELLLPDDFRSFPFIKEKNYSVKYKPKPGERRAALKFLKQNLSLSKEELKIINRKENTRSIIEMKKWIDKYGLDEEQKKFIDWAISYLVEKPGESVPRLNSIYELIKLQDYSPKDREPINPL